MQPKAPQLLKHGDKLILVFDGYGQKPVELADPLASKYLDRKRKVMGLVSSLG